MTWNDSTPINTDWITPSSASTSWGSITVPLVAWQDQSNINNLTSIFYNDPVAYNADYLTYNGYYIQNEINWNGIPDTQTAWSA